jgi:hypothetical protein
MEFSNLILFCNLNSFMLINSIYFIEEIVKHIHLKLCLVVCACYCNMFIVLRVRTLIRLVVQL